MATDSLSKWWIASKRQLEKLTEYDVELIKMKSVRDRSLANKLVGGLYAEYSIAVQELTECLDAFAPHVQQTATARKLTDAAVRRLHELQLELTRLDISEYHYYDDALIERKLIPHHVEILRPNYVFPRDDNYDHMYERLKNGETIYTAPTKEEDEAKANLTKKKQSFVPSADNSTTGLETHPEEQTSAILRKGSSKRIRKMVRPKMSYQIEAEMSAEEKAEMARKEQLRQVVQMIQEHERARQARLYYYDARASAAKAEAGGRRLSTAQSRLMTATVVAATASSTGSAGECEHAASVIQRGWRAHRARKWAHADDERRQLIMRMTEPSVRAHAEHDRRRRIAERNLETRRAALRDFHRTLADERARVLRVIAPGLFEDIGDELREWFRSWYVGARILPDALPTIAEGGSVLIVRGDVLTLDEHLDAVAKAARNARKAPPPKPPPPPPKTSPTPAGKAVKISPLNYVFEPKRTAAIIDIETQLQQEQGDESMDVITEQMCYEIQLKVRRNVDVVMRLELELLKTALLKDKGKKTKKKKNKKLKINEMGKRGGGGTKMGAAAGVAAALQELYDERIVHTYPEVHMDEYVGDFSYQNWEQRWQAAAAAAAADPPPTLADARQAVIASCVLPLGVETAMATRPHAVLLVGPVGSGLDMLARAVFTETRCVLFDLSPSRLAATRYVGGEKRAARDLVENVSRLARLLAPSVVYVGGAERAFYKRVPRDERATNPTRIGKLLSASIVRRIRPEDRVLMLGTTNAPQLAHAKRLRAAFPTIILVPRADYGSVYLFWRTLLMPYNGVARDFNISALATLSRHRSYADVRDAVHTVMTPQRIIQLRYRPLQQHEFLDALVAQARTAAAADAEWAKIVKFCDGSKTGRLRRKLVAIIADEAAKK